MEADQNIIRECIIERTEENIGAKNKLNEKEWSNLGCQDMLRMKIEISLMWWRRKRKKLMGNTKLKEKKKK